MGHIVWKKNKGKKGRPAGIHIRRFRPGSFYILFKILLATLMPFAEACCRPLVTEAPSPMALRPLYAGFKVFVNHYLVGVEFYFYAVEQGLIAGNTGSDLVQCQDHFLDIRHNAVGEDKG